MFKINSIFAIICSILCLTTAVRAQETEPASSSNLTGITLPANAQRVSPASVPAEISQTLQKIVASGNGKLRQGDSEVLAWTDGGYKKSQAAGITGKLRTNLQAGGWAYEVGGEESGVTVFSALKDGAERRAVVGFYAATDEAFLLAWTEVLSPDSAKNTIEAAPQTQRIENAGTAKPTGGMRELIGEWRNGNVSMLQEKNLTTGQVSSSNGSTFSYKFFADGRFEYIGYMKSTMYGCTTDLFNDKRGTLEINGNQITFIPTKNYWKNTYSCSPASNKERNYVLERETYTYRLKTDEYGKTLVCLANAKGETCYRREE